MTDCDYKLGEDGLYRCSACGDVKPVAVRRNCKKPATLAGDRLKAFFAAIGVPACAGCEERAETINGVHQWIKDNVTG